MKLYLFGFFLMAIIASVPAGARDNPGEPGRKPILVELFTSEGCSSCPPADALLMQLDRDQPVPGAEVIILSQHVDYWNHLGWTDPFSSKEFSKRQESYAFTLGTSGPYTPQMVVDGRTEFVGSDARQARDAIARAARNPKADVALTLSPAPEGERLQIHATGIAGKADVMLAVTESKLSTQVQRGENGGRMLAHSGVVRRLSLVGTAAKPEFSADQVVVLDKAWKRENLRVIVFLQEHTGRRVLGVASASVL
jgi:hypothetical protein